jgi:hypothetical protein
MEQAQTSAAQAQVATEQEVYGGASQGGGQEQASPIRHPDFEKGMAQLQQGLERRAELIRNDQTIDSTERRIQMQELWDKAVEARAQLTEIYERQLEEDSADIEKRVFYTIPSERDSVRSAYNDVYDRTALAYESGDADGISHAREELERLYERAERTGDSALLKAVFHIATERGEHALRDRYLATHPEKHKAWTDYVSTRQRLAHCKDPGERLWGSLTGSWMLSKPPEA